MFRIEVFVDDKKLAETLRALAGLVLQDPKIQPVTNAQVEKGKVSATTASGKLIDLFTQVVRREKLAEVTITYAKQFLRSQSKAETSYAYLMDKAVETGLVKKVGSGVKRRFLVKELAK